MFIEKITKEDLNLLQEDEKVLKGENYDNICGIYTLDNKEAFPAFGFNEFF